MSSYEAKKHYQDGEVARRYNSQYKDPLNLSNFRDKLVGWGEVRAFQKMLRHVPRGGSVLDVACGTGRYLKQLLDCGYKVYGLDISDEMLEFAREVTQGDPNIQLLKKGDAENLPFNDHQFDGVTCIRLYQRVPPAQRLQMLREVKRVARSWAILFFGMSNSWLRVRQAIRWKLISGRLNNPNALTVTEMRQELLRAGLKLEESTWVLPGIASGMIVRVSLCD